MPKPRTTLVVRSTQWMGERYIRVVLGGPGFAAFRPSVFTDSYVKLVFPRDGSEALRAYTVREVDTVAEQIVIDFVYHGDEGIAGPWAAAARPGDAIEVQGPGGAYAPRSGADWHLLAGDEAAVPAIAVALESLPDDAVGEAFLEVGGPTDELPLSHPRGVTVTWLRRGALTPGVALAQAVRAAAWRPGRVQVFVHGEAQAVMHDLRPYLRRERAVPAEWASISGYWRHGVADEEFRRWKKALTAAEAASVGTAAEAALEVPAAQAH